MKEFSKDLLSTLCFLAVYWTIGDIFIATGVAIAVGVLQIAVGRLRGRKIDPMQWMSLALVIVFGGATIYLHDPRFVMVKPSLIHFAVGCVMLRRGWIGRYLPEVARERLSARMIDGWGYGWAAFMFTMGVANLVFALFAGPVLWSYFAMFAIAAKIAFFSVQYMVFRTAVLRRLAGAGAG